MKKQMIIGIALTLGIIVFLGIYAGLESSREAKAQTAVSNGELLLGAKLFVSNCAECHGDQGQGFQGPPLNGTDLPQPLLTQIVREGWPHTIMPAWSSDFGGPFDELQVQQVVNWVYHWDDAILAQAQKEAGPETGMDMGSGNYTMPGQMLFNTKGCAECHGDDGRGRVFTWSEAVCGRCHTDPTLPLQYTPMVIGHQDSEVRDQVRNGGDFMQPFSTDTISDAQLQQIIDWIDTQKVAVIDGELLADLEAAKTDITNGDNDTAQADLQKAVDAAPYDIWKAQIQKIASQLDDDTGDIVIALINEMEANPQDSPPRTTLPFPRAAGFRPAAFPFPGCSGV